MISILNLLTILIVGLARVAFADVDFNLGSFENLNVLQTIDVVAPYLKQTFDLQIENVGTEDASSYLFVVPEDRGAYVASIIAKDVRGTDLEVVKVDTHPISGYDVYNVIFDVPVIPGRITQFGVKMSFSKGGVVPYPAEAKQMEAQWMLYRGYANYVSVYKTRSQEAQLSLLTANYEVLKENGKTEKPEVDPTGFITFGPYKDVASLETVPLSLRFENPLPLVFVENLNQTVWVSHWGGSVSLDETYEVHNVGTKLKGPFSRLDFAKPKVGFSLNNAAIRGLRIPMPEGHREEYFVDLVGNVSTSVVNGDFLEMSPRYPIMGGWFYNFTVGWASDISKFVRTISPSNYALSVPVVGGPDNVAYGKVYTKVVLPEGALFAEVFSGVEYDNLDTSVTYSYLDIYGRPTFELEFSNVVSEQANKNIYVTYHYSPLMSLRKPASYTVAVLACLIATKFVIKLF